MKLQDFLIAIGLFSVFSIIIFGFINTNNNQGIYSETYLNITHDTETNNAIGNISAVGVTTKSDYDSVSGKMDEFTSNGSTTEERTEGSLVGEGLNVLINVPQSYKPVSNVLRVMGVYLKIPSEFTTWVVSSVIIIIILILLASVLKNKLQS